MRGGVGLPRVHGRQAPRADSKQEFVFCNGIAASEDPAGNIQQGNACEPRQAGNIAEPRKAEAGLPPDNISAPPHLVGIEARALYGTKIIEGFRNWQTRSTCIRVGSGRCYFPFEAKGQTTPCAFRRERSKIASPPYQQSIPLGEQTQCQQFEHHISSSRKYATQGIRSLWNSRYPSK